MDNIAEIVARVAGTFLGEIVETVLGAIFHRIARFIGAIYNAIHQTVRWNLNSDFLATPVTILLMLTLGGALFFTLVKAILWMIA